MRRLLCWLFGHRPVTKRKVRHLRASGMSYLQLAAPEYQICERCGLSGERFLP